MQITDNAALDHIERKAVVRCFYDYRDARLPQDGRAKFASMSQYKAIRCTGPTLQPCVHCAIFSCIRTFCSILATVL